MTFRVTRSDDNDGGTRVQKTREIIRLRMPQRSNKRDTADKENNGCVIGSPIITSHHARCVDSQWHGGRCSWGEMIHLSHDRCVGPGRPVSHVGWLQNGRMSRTQLVRSFRQSLVLCSPKNRKKRRKRRPTESNHQQKKHPCHPQWSWLKQQTSCAQ